MKTIRKAILAGAVALVGSITTAIADGELTGVEIIVAVLTAAVAGVGVYQVPNASPEEGI